MQRLKGRNVLFGALAVLACSGDPTGNESTPTAIQSSPEVVFVAQGDSEAVVVTVIDEDGQVLQADFTATDIGSGITVRRDPTYQEVTAGNPIRRGTRFFVSGVNLTHTSFKVNALGLSKTIDVTSVPGTLNAEITDTLPTLGDTLTITAPAGTFFTDSTTLTFAGAAPVVVSQNETTITFIPMPNIFGPALISDVGVTSNPALAFDLATPYNVKTDSIIDIGTDVTPLTPALGAPVTLNLPAGLKLLPESLVTLTIANAPVAPRNRVLSADSTSITFVPPPNADSFVVVSGVVPELLAGCCAGAAGYALPLGTSVKVTTPVVDSIPSNVSSATPAGGADVTLTSTDANFSFAPTSRVVVGADTAITTGVAGASITFVPTPGTTGVLTVTDVQVVGFPLALPSNAGEITVGTTVAATPGTGDPGTAPTIPEPTVSIATGFVDGNSYGFACAAIYGPAAGCQLHKLVLTSDEIVHLKGNWSNSADLGFYFLESDGATDTGIFCDDNGRDGPEECDLEFVAGTYYLVVVPFGEFYPENDPTPDWVRVQLSITPPAE
jgi:hypothetical protein